MANPKDQTAEFVSRVVSIQPQLRAYIRMMIFNPSDVGDVLQETVAAAWEHYDSYDPTRPFDAWIIGIARNRIREYRRDQAKHAHPLSWDVLELIEAEADDLYQSGANQLDDALETCLGKLSAEDQQLVRTRYEKADSNRQASQLLGLSESTVSRVLSRIYAQLLICIKQQQRAIGVQS